MPDWRDDLKHFGRRAKPGKASRKKPKTDKARSTAPLLPVNSAVEAPEQVLAPDSAENVVRPAIIEAEATASTVEAIPAEVVAVPEGEWDVPAGRNSTSEAIRPAPSGTEKHAMEATGGEIPVIRFKPAIGAPGELVQGLTQYHAKYFANDVTKVAPSGDLDRLSQSLFDASIDLQPHQVEAALFAVRSPLSKGAILADEVGLGKTIEAGLVLCQSWAERRRKLLVICPASLRKQWQQELETKFNLPSVVLEGKEHKRLRKEGHANPFSQEHIVIVSYQFASNKRNELQAVPWDLAVIDEAHKLRNPETKASQHLRQALLPVKKVLLTATPLQNHLAELHTLTTFVDEHAFGDAKSFRALYSGDDVDFVDLQERLRPFVKRTLRNDVKEYVNYTARIPMTQPFEPPAAELALYNQVSEFLQRDDLLCLPPQVNALMTLMFRKILASSTPALERTLSKMRARLQAGLDGDQLDPTVDFIDEEAITDEEAEEMAAVTPQHEEWNPAKARAEIEQLDAFISMAQAIDVDEKTRALAIGLDAGFQRLAELGAQQRALIFTESRRTQQYLKEYLETNGYGGQVVTFNGTNNEADSKAICRQWVDANQDNGRATGNPMVDIRTALTEHFRDHATIMIATEAAAEGVNMQFCSLVVNYDLPWNPQRIEQRIGRCHRYGQQHDVVVINFVNTRNAADVRVHELLETKFHLFDGVFGSSDEVLGQIESGVDFERRILAIYQDCRNPQEIQDAFDSLQAEMESAITSRMADVRQKLLEHFDEEVHGRFRDFMADAQSHLDEMERQFWATTKYILAPNAIFDDAALEFDLQDPPIAVPATRYQMINRTTGGRLDMDADDAVYRMAHPLGEHVLDAAKELPCPAAAVTFDASGHAKKISVLEQLQGQRGWMAASKLTVTAFGAEEHLLLTGITEDGSHVDQDVLKKMFHVAASELQPLADVPHEAIGILQDNAGVQVQTQLNETLARNEEYFNEQEERLNRWADDLIAGAKKSLEDQEAKISGYRKAARHATNLPEKLEATRKMRTAEANLRNARRRLFEAEDDIRGRRDAFVDELTSRLHQDLKVEPLFVVQWGVA